ncbi:MAG: helix-turn-helix transcriptional regulator [Deltaproteobacteria bacterium]|nr:helix-turn-helix transcriptional regulator [Deltaproteobacteria bacterium]
MIRYHLKHLIADSELKLGRRVSLQEISKETGIHLSTLSRIANQKAANTTIGNLEKICQFFDCEIQDLVEFVKEDEGKKGPPKTSRGE